MSGAAATIRFRFDHLTANPITHMPHTNSEGTDTMSIESKALGIIDGFTITAHIELDTDTSPRDFEMYGDDVISSWERDEWHYVGTVITASRARIDLGTASIWGQEYGAWPGSGFVSPLDGDGDTLANGYGPQLIREAITAAQVKLEELRHADRESVVQA